MRRPSRSSVRRLGVVAATLGPLGVSAVRLIWLTGYRALGDDAAIELHVRGVGRHLVLLGPYSRYGFQQPGPALFGILAVPYRLLGSSSTALLAGALAIVGGSMLGIVLVAYRRGGVLPATCTAIVTLLLARSLGATTLRDPWNVYVTVLPLLLLILLTWSLACGDPWMLPWAAGVSTFLVQSHVAYVPASLALVAWGCARLAFLTRGQSRDEASKATVLRPALVTAAVLVVLWLPVAVDQLRGGHNLQRIARFFTHQHAVASWHEAWHVFALQTSWRAEWLSGPRPVGFLGSLYEQPADIPVLLLIGAVVLTVVVLRRSRELVGLGFTVLLALGVAAVALHGIAVPIFAYTVLWTRAVGAALGIFILWGVVALITERVSNGGRRALAAFLLLGLASISVADIAAATSASVPSSARQHLNRSAGTRVIAATRRGDGPVLVRGFVADFNLWNLVLALDQAGIPTKVEPALGRFLGEWKVGHGRHYRRVLVVHTDADAVASLAHPTSGTVVAHATIPRSVDDVRKLEALIASVQRHRPENHRLVSAMQRALAVMRTTPSAEIIVVAQP